MTLTNDPRKTSLLLVTCLGMASCTPVTRPDTFRTNFLPAVPRPVLLAPIAPKPVEPEFIEPPVLVAANHPPKEVPHYLTIQPRIAARPQLDNRIRRAEERFAAGRKLYLEGDTAGARSRFDEAIDLLLGSSETAPDRAAAERKLDELVDKIHRYDVEGLGAGDIQEAVSYDKSPLREILELTFPIDPGMKSRLKDQVAATRSQLPLEENDEVLRYISYLSSERGKRTVIAGMRRAGRYSDMIRRILDEEGVPQELIFLAQAESGFMPRALSYKAAVGMWQFVKWRGNEYGLMQSAYTDDRLDPEKATRAGARHLRDLYHQFGDWYLAMAAYNCGPGCVTRAVQRTGYADFWQLRSRNVLPKETANYVPLIVAMTIVVKNAKDYGIEDAQPDPALQYDTIEMVANTDLTLVSDLLDTPLTELRELNPALLKTMAPTNYALRIPKGSSQVLMAGLSKIPADKRASWRAHRVQDGETLASIAKRYRTLPDNIANVNRANVSDLQTGDLVVIPAAYIAPKAPAKWTSRTAPKQPVSTKANVNKVTAKPAPVPARKPPLRRASNNSGNTARGAGL